MFHSDGMKLSALFEVIAILFACTCTMDSASDRQDRERNFKMYERAGPYVLGRETPLVKEIPLMQASARDFLWRHWRERRLGFLTLISFSMEGLPTRLTYFVEPDKDGRWTIFIQTKTTLLGTRPGSTEHFQNEGTSVAYSIERFQLLPDGAPSDKRVDANEISNAESYRLVLKDRKGTVI